jgi:hypothetical protein
MRNIFRPASHLYQATPRGTMGSLFMKDEVEQGTVHDRTAIAVDTDRLMELVHEETLAGPGGIDLLPEAPPPALDLTAALGRIDQKSRLSMFSRRP